MSTYRWCLLAASLTLGAVAVNGCGWEWGAEIGSCIKKTDPDYHKPYCLKARCDTDAATPDDDCGESSSSSSSSSGGSSSSARCSGTCVDNAPNEFSPPQPVYIGPPKAKYAVGCPLEYGKTAGFQYAGLNVPAPGCPACVCGPIDGSCAPPPTITLRAGSCDMQPVESVNFSGPENWDGSCTNVNAMPAGAECPPGSGISCAQSIDSSTLAPPVEGCEPIPLPVPKATNDKPWWSKVVMSCNSSVLPGTCDNAASTTCLPALPADEPDWRYCVRRLGVHECPNFPGATFVEPFVAYDGFIDTRTCTECGCQASGGACYGTLRVYTDDACSTNEINSFAVGSGMTNCDNLAPTGDPFGSKEFTDLTYLPGKCEPTGGEPIGTVTEIKSQILKDGTEEQTVTTWCCQPPLTDGGASAE